ncbi:MAG: DUF7225 domain-containing protein [Burkholderiales bacterium]
MDNVQRLLEYVVQNLADNLDTKILGNEYYYHCLPLAAIDAVFSAQAKYPSVQNVVQRYCSKYEQPVFRSPRDRLPPPKNQESVSALIRKMKQDGIPYFVEKVFVNRSVTSGRPKAEILLELLETFEKLQIQTFQDIQAWLNQPDQQLNLIRAMTSIHGIGEATYRYFLMLAGDDQLVKPDTMILRFIKNAIGTSANETEAVRLIQAISQQLLPQYPKLNPRLLDYMIWSWQRDQSNDSKSPSLQHQKKYKSREDKPKQKESTIQTPQNGIMTIPQKTQRAMLKRYQPGQLLTSSQIKDDVFEDYRTPRGSVMPADYCCNKWNADPASGIHHVFFFEQNQNKYRLLPELDLTEPRQRGNCA